MQCTASLASQSSNSYILHMKMMRQTQRLNGCTRRLFSGLLIQLALFCVGGRAQGSAGTDALLETRALVDLPTAGMLAQRTLALDINFFQKGSVLANFSVGIFNRFLVGVSYGGTSVIGSETPSSNPRPGFVIKIRVIDESVILPAIALGFDSQGKELFVDSLDRNAIKPLGIYAVGSKNYQLLGYLSIHGGINYSNEQGDGNKNLNYFVGAEKTVGPFASVALEYNFNVNDEFRAVQGNSGGYLNAGVRLAIGNGFTLGFNFKDIVKNQQLLSVSSRTMQIEYVKAF